MADIFDIVDPDDYTVDQLHAARAAIDEALSLRDKPIIRANSIITLLEQHRIACPSRESMFHMLRVIEFAARSGRLDALTERMNYLACREDETVIFNRDGRPDEMSFFWQQISREEYRYAVSMATFRRDDMPLPTDYTPDFRYDFVMPDRKTYHGGLICRRGYTPLEWTIHT